MTSKVEACPMCTHNCLMTHGNRTSSRNLVTSFFKVLIGNQFLTVLVSAKKCNLFPLPHKYFPPKFAPTVSSLNGQETFLEDSSGQRWKVKVSILNDSFVLQEGWSAFASDHGLELGDFIIFNYIMGSHFEVHIYDKSACERLDFSERRNQKERTGNDTQNFNTEYGQYLAKDKGSKNVHGSSTPNLAGEEICRGQSKLKNDVLKAKMVAKNTSSNKKETRAEKIVSKAECVEESSDMINRELGKKHEDYRETLVDLSKWGLSKANLGNEGSKKTRAGT
ncbi:hypothetical protein POTOM_060620 [Populus tomentosa]|uniref:TF-B3 domain-containing protein n=1 Tax=Populus tomentosa TaxID=118781 RepID=A0A8X8C1S9_POPTO|nr:hypothetical protein POTOM_060620 [Populus tomentosa]